LHLTDLVHIIVGFFLSVFMVIHIYLCTIGKPAGTNFRAIMSGWHHSG
jgi:thiosulfate reductase cytochrome b subunit